MADEAKSQMSDAALEVFLGIAGTKQCAAIMAGITPEQRATYEEMLRVDRELALWEAGLGPKPAGVIVCRERRGRR